MKALGFDFALYEHIGQTVARKVTQILFFEVDGKTHAVVETDLHGNKLWHGFIGKMLRKSFSIDGVDSVIDALLIDDKAKHRAGVKLAWRRSDGTFVVDSPLYAALEELTGVTPPGFVRGRLAFLGIATEAERNQLQEWCRHNAKPEWATGEGVLMAAEVLVADALRLGRVNPSSNERVNEYLRELVQ